MARKARAPRAASTYRAARRNVARGTVWQGITPKMKSSWIIYRNRSRKWDGVPLTKPYR